jgi:hypothetical protein
MGMSGKPGRLRRWLPIRRGLAETRHRLRSLPQTGNASALAHDGAAIGISLGIEDYVVVRSADEIASLPGRLEHPPT